MRKASLHLPFAISLAVHAAVGTFAVRAIRSPAPSPLVDASDVGGGDSFDVPEEVALTPMGESPGITPATRDEAIRPIRAAGRANGHGVHAMHSTEVLPPPVAFGAAGERGSVDLATAFTRGFPQAASTDAAWARVAMGSAGEAEVVLDIDEAGALVASEVTGHPSAALRAGIARTLALIGARAFTSSAPRTRLHVVATISPDDVHDGLHGDVFAIGGSFVAAEGSAFFALAIGRRIDLRVRVKQ